MSVFVVIPAFNEEKNICPVVRDIFSLYPDFKIIVVDDGSNDKTATMARNCGAIVLQHLINRGQGAALKTGTDYALRLGGEIIVHYDADRQFEPKEIGPAVAIVKKGQTEIVLGSRFLSKQNNLPWSKKRIILPLARLVNFLFTGRWLSDAHNGFRVLSHRAATLMDIRQDRMAHNSEIVRLIKENNLSFQEQPITVYYHQYGQSFGGGVKIIKDLIIGRFLR